MIVYKVCSHVSMAEIFQGFSIGFSDYVIPLTMTQDDFEAHFFGPEGNDRAVSFIAFDQNVPIGLVLGGMRQWEGMLTMRCGALCVAPDYRGKGVAQTLYTYHLESAKAHGCKQLFLEVIKGNDRAIQFYKNKGYEVVYDLYYYSAEVSALRLQRRSTQPVISTTYEAIVELRKSLPDLHINWQSDVESYENHEGHQFLAVQEGSALLGAMAISTKGKINFIWVSPERRQEGIAIQMILTAGEMMALEKVNICFPSNARVHGFVRHSKFIKAVVEQHEMYLTL